MENKSIATIEDYRNSLWEATDYFWCPDAAWVWIDEGGIYRDEPLLIHHGNINEVWGWFKDYAVQYVTENLEYYENKIVSQIAIKNAINDYFEDWLNYQKEKYPNRVLV